MTKGPKDTVSSCSFCGKPYDEVDKLISGPDVTICAECVELCYEIITQRKARKTEGEVAEDELDSGVETAAAAKGVPTDFPEFENLSPEQARAEYERFKQKYVAAANGMTSHQRFVTVFDARASAYEEILKKLKKIIDADNQ